jgi:hypothetical protein
MAVKILQVSVLTGKDMGKVPVRLLCLQHKNDIMAWPTV